MHDEWTTLGSFAPGVGATRCGDSRAGDGETLLVGAKREGRPLTVTVRHCFRLVTKTPTSLLAESSRQARPSAEEGRPLTVTSSEW